jgi:hypothetical protein
MKHLKAGTLLAIFALLVLIGGTATAANLINGSQIRKGTVTAKQIRNKTITVSKLSPATVASLRGRTGAAGPAGVTGPTGATGVAGSDGVVSPLTATAGTVVLPTDQQTEVLQLDLPAGGYMLTGRVSLISQAPSDSNRATCSIAIDELSDFDLVDSVGQSPLALNDEVNLSLMALAVAADKATVLCSSDSGFSQVTQARLIAVPVGD